MVVYFALSSVILSFCYNSLILPQFQQVPYLIFEKMSLHRRTKMHSDFVACPDTFTQKNGEASGCSTKIFWLLSEVSENNFKVPWEYGRMPKPDGEVEATYIYSFKLSSFSTSTQTFISFSVSQHMTIANSLLWLLLWIIPPITPFKNLCSYDTWFQNTRSILKHSLLTPGRSPSLLLPEAFPSGFVYEGT